MAEFLSDSRFGESASLYLRYLALIPAAIVVAALYFGRPVLLPLAVAVLLAFAIAPFVGRLRRIGLGRLWSVLIASFVSIAFLVGIGVFVAIKTVQLADQLPLYQNNLIQKIQSIRGTADETSVLGRAAAMLRNLRDQATGAGNTAASSATQRGLVRRPDSGPVAVEIRQPEPAPLEIAATLMTRLLTFLMAAGIIVVFVVFILFAKEDIRDRFIRLAGSRDIQRTTLLLDEGAERLGRYLLTQTAINAAFGILIAGGLWLIGLPNPELWGISVMVLRFVPYIGVPLAAILPLLLALAVDPGWSMAIWTFALFMIGEIIFGQAVEPLLYGRGLGLSPAAVIIAATFWTWLWGPAGLLLSTPLTLCLVVLGRHVAHLQFLDVLLGDQPALSAEEALYIRMLGDDADDAAAEAEIFIKENSLSRYYNDVVLKALLIAQADINRGALDSDRVLKIRETTQALIENLSDIEAEQSAPSPGVEAPAPDKGVLCIGGRGPLDEAATLLFMHLLEKAGVPARLASKAEGSDTNVYHLDNIGARTVCLCYLDHRNITRARYLLRRLKRRNPDAVTIAAFWGFPEDGARLRDALGCDVVTKFDDAVQAILASTQPAARQPEAA